MELGRLLQELMAAARKAGITVRAEPFDPALSEQGRRFRGGLCVVRGQRIILVDERAPLVDRIATLAAALAAVDLEHIFLPPIVRATIGAYQRDASQRPLPNLTEPLPLVRTRWRDRGDDEEPE
jgi:hypothetical protein